MFVEKRFAFAGLVHGLELVVFAVLGGELSEGRFGTQAALFHKLDKLVSLFAHPEGE